MGAQGSGTSVPTFSGTADGTLICHREYVGEVTGSINFTSQTFALNPALDTTFPWLASTAKNFELYEMQGCVYEFVSTSADALNSTNTALGSLLMATKYNSENPGFSSKLEMMQYEFSTSGRPSVNHCHMIECAKNDNPYKMQYTRAGGVPTGADARLYDIGNFTIATEGMQAVAKLGELWVTYKVNLKKPKLSLDLGQGYWRYNAVAGVATPFGNPGTGVLASANNMSITTDGVYIYWPIETFGKAYKVNIDYYQPSGALNGTSGLVMPAIRAANSGLSFTTPTDVPFAVGRKSFIAQPITTTSGNGSSFTQYCTTQANGQQNNMAWTGGMTMPTNGQTTYVEIVIIELPSGY